MGPVVAVAELAEGGLAPVSLELASLARELAGALGCQAKLVVLGEGAEPLAQEAARLSGLAVIGVEVTGLEMFSGEAHCRLLADLWPQLNPSYVLAAHTTSGLDWAPGLAVLLEAAYISGVESWRMEADTPCFGRAAQHGKVVEEIEPLQEPVVLTVQPGSFPQPEATTAEPGRVELLTRELPPCRSKVSPGAEAPSRDAALASASVVVAAGRGIGKQANLELLRDLAGLFSSAVLAGSRPVCDLGWLGYGQQVGQTGATVSPRLYLACGISGARQHTVGMQASGFIVAINSDPQAAIFNLADVCVVEDLLGFIPVLVEQAGASGNKLT